MGSGLCIAAVNSPDQKRNILIESQLTSQAGFCGASEVCSTSKAAFHLTVWTGAMAALSILGLIVGIVLKLASQHSVWSAGARLFDNLTPGWFVLALLLVMAVFRLGLCRLGALGRTHRPCSRPQWSASRGAGGLLRAS